MQTERTDEHRRYGARMLLILLFAAILLGVAPTNPVVSGPSPAIASQAGTGGGGP